MDRIVAAIQERMDECKVTSVYGGPIEAESL